MFSSQMMTLVPTLEVKIIIIHQKHNHNLPHHSALAPTPAPAVAVAPAPAPTVITFITFII
jgi:hypothetical protein